MQDQVGVHELLCIGTWFVTPEHVKEIRGVTQFGSRRDRLEAFAHAVARRDDDGHL